MSEDPFIAVIDDDDPFRTAVVESLRSYGYRVRDFASAEDFVARHLASSCSCVITDLHMSGMSGLELLLLLTSCGVKIPVILITAHAEAGLETKAATGGAAGLLRKPFASGDLIGCLEKAMRIDG